MKVLLINPPVYDFAAYSLWARPIGLLKIASVLKANNVKFSYLDTLDIGSLNKSELKQYRIKIKNSGRHTYIKKEVKKPACLSHISRKFHRFGMPEEKISGILGNYTEKPDFIIITSIMTYWYLGVFESISMLKKFFPKAKIILGGIYVNLCTEHAKRFSGADFIVKTIEEVCKILGIKNVITERLPLDVYEKNYFAPIYTSYGCPFSCMYCANRFLNEKFTTRSNDDVLNEILYYHNELKIKNFAFYDDALLINKGEHFIPLMKKIFKENLPVKFYCPNGLHVSEITEEVAETMKEAGIVDIRLSLETANEELQKKLGYKTDNSSFVNAVKNLKKAGFTKENISVYLLVGLPYQTIEDIIDSVNFAKRYNVKIKLAEYSPIPHTELWKDSVKVSKYNLTEEPLFHNNKILPTAPDELTFEKLNEIKKHAHA